MKGWEVCQIDPSPENSPALLGLKVKLEVFLTQTVYGRWKKVSKTKTQKKSEENTINSIRSLSILKRNKII